MHDDHRDDETNENRKLSCDQHLADPLRVSAAGNVAFAQNSGGIESRQEQSRIRRGKQGERAQCKRSE